MIISVRSISYDDLKKKLSAKNDRILIWSCNNCIRACGLGGAEKAGHLRAILREDGFNVIGTELISISCNRSLIAERERNEEKRGLIEDATTIIMLACDDGNECVQEAFPDKTIVGTSTTVGGGGMTAKGPLLTTPLEKTGLANKHEGYTLKEVADKMGLFPVFFEPERKPTPPPQVPFVVNGKACQAPAGANLLEACEQNGFPIPHLCYLKGLSAPAVCRLCLVKIGPEQRLVPACREPVVEGLAVSTDDEEIRYLRRTNLEFLLSAHEHNCLLCGETRIARGKCELQTLVREFGIESVPYPVNRKALPVDDSHPVIIKDPNKCVLCGRCIRACAEVAGRHNLSLGNRGRETVIASGANEPMNETACAGCLACVMACPTGALTEKLLHFTGEEWKPTKIFL